MQATLESSFSRAVQQRYGLDELPGPHTASKLGAAKASASDDRLKNMLDVAADVQWPEAFCDDLYIHDVATLAESAGESFVWILRPNGTHLYPIVCENSHDMSAYRRTIEYWGGNHKLNTFVDGDPKTRYYIVRPASIEEVSADGAYKAFKLKQ